MRGALIALVVCALAPAAAAATKPPSTHTKTGLASARAALLPAHAFPSRWTATAADKTVPALGCPFAGADSSGIVEIGAATSPHYRAGSVGPFASESVYVYKTAQQAATYWKRLVGPGIGRCLAASVKQGSTSDVTFSEAKQLPLAAPTVTGRAAAYRVSAHAATPGQTTVAYFDLVLVARGAGIAALSFSSFSTPTPAGIEALLARSAAGRLPR
jgi:hypothetical protein